MDEHGNEHDEDTAFNAFAKAFEILRSALPLGRRRVMDLASVPSSRPHAGREKGVTSCAR
jgi:hypothetical protein